MALVIPEVQMRATGCCLVAWLLAAAPGAAQDWPQWRGPARDGVVSAAVTPDAWPAAWQRAWAFEIGEGYASPVVVGDRAYTFSRQDPLEVVTALSLTDGTVFWQQLYQAPRQLHAGLIDPDTNCVCMARQGRHQRQPRFAAGTQINSRRWRRPLSQHSSLDLQTRVGVLDPCTQ